MRVNEIFYSLQGEGFFTGTPAVFLRFSGCNLRCDFCDTNHESFREMTEEEIVAAITCFPARHVVITGGEPAIQLTATLVEKLHETGRFVQIETNGSLKLQSQVAELIDWVTVSPKNGILPSIQRIDELKLVYDSRHKEDIEKLEDVVANCADAYFLQPCDRGDEALNQANREECIDYILQHPKWRLSLQTHKIINIR